MRCRLASDEFAGEVVKSKAAARKRKLYLIAEAFALLALREVLQKMGQDATEQELFDMVNGRKKEGD